MQLRPAVQLAIDVHTPQTVSAEAEHAVLTYWPAAQVLHTAQLSAAPSTR